MKASHVSFERAVELLPYPTRQQAFRSVDGWEIRVTGQSVALEKAETSVVVVGVPFVYVPAPAPGEFPDIATEVEKLMRPPPAAPVETQQKPKRRR